MDIMEKVAYLKGLAEGLALDGSTKEGKLFSAIIDLLEDIGLELEDLCEQQEELEAGLDTVSDDLNDVETFLFDDEDDDEDEEDEEYDGEVYETTCPNCEEEVLFDETILDEGFVNCPNCGEKLEFDLSDVSGDCCCDCCEDEE